MLSYAQNEQLKEITLNAVNSLNNSESNGEIEFSILVIESNKAMIPFQYPNTKTIYPNQKFGFHRYMNIGIKRTGNPFICICNNDLIFYPGWASAIINAFQHDKGLASASPYCSFRHPALGIGKDTGNYYGFDINKELAGWCIFFKREILAITGLLDPMYKFWYADNDYAMTLKKHTLKHALISSSVVDHLGCQTILATRNLRDQYKLTIGERFYYEYKWEGRSYNSYKYLKRKFNTMINMAEEEDDQGT